MKFEVMEKLPVSFKQTKNMRVIEEFLNMEARIVKLNDDNGEYTNNMSMRNSLSTTIKRFAYNVRVCMIDGEVYLTKEGI